MTTTRRALTGLALGLVAAAGGVLAPAAVAPARAADDCAGVWVVVGGQGTRCATEYSSGKVALKSAGFAVRDQSPGFLCQINNYPQTCSISENAHWAYWQASRNADGSWGPWRYSQVGYASSSPRKGDAEGWVFGAGLYGPKPPAPPAAPKPAPKPAPTTQAPAPAPSSKAPAPAPSPKAPAPAPSSKAPAPTQPKADQPGATATAAAPAPGSAGPSADTPPDSPTPNPTDVEPTASASTPEVGTTPGPDPTSVGTVSDTGSPVGALVTGGVLLAGGGALGGWWWLRRRTP